MVTISQRENFMLSSKHSSEQDSHIVGFTTTVAQKNLIVLRTQLIAKSLGVLALEFSQVDWSGMHELIRLLRDDFG